MRKPNLLYVFAYLIAGISFGLFFGFFIFALYAERLAQVAYADVGFDNNFAVNLILLFILISVVLLPLSIYLSKFYGRARVFIIAVIIAAILTGAIFFYNNAKNSGVVEVETIPLNK